MPKKKASKRVKRGCWPVFFAVSLLAHTAFFVAASSLFIFASGFEGHEPYKDSVIFVAISKIKQGLDVPLSDGGAVSRAAVARADTQQTAGSREDSSGGGSPSAGSDVPAGAAVIEAQPGGPEKADDIVLAKGDEITVNADSGDDEKISGSKTAGPALKLDEETGKEPFPSYSTVKPDAGLEHKNAVTPLNDPVPSIASFSSGGGGGENPNGQKNASAAVSSPAGLGKKTVAPGNSMPALGGTSGGTALTGDAGTGHSQKGGILTLATEGPQGSTGGTAGGTAGGTVSAGAEKGLVLPGRAAVASAGTAAVPRGAKVLYLTGSGPEDAPAPSGGRPGPANGQSDEAGVIYLPAKVIPDPRDLVVKVVRTGGRGSYSIFHGWAPHPLSPKSFGAVGPEFFFDGGRGIVAVDRAVPGIYTIGVKYDSMAGGPAKVTFEVTVFGADPARRKTRMIGPVGLDGAGSIPAVRLLLPECVFWEDDSWFTGVMESGRVTTKYKNPEGVVWKEKD